MNFYDLLIIYLACGAPIGVHYYIRKRKSANFPMLWLKTLLNFVFWIPSAYRILFEHRSLKKLFRNGFDSRFGMDANIENNILPQRKYLETTIINKIPQSAKSIPAPSVFEVREILDRYVGLTVSCQNERENSQFERNENEFYRTFAKKSAALGSICSARRNRQRLFFHQSQARRDFLNLINAADDFDLYRLSIQFARQLKDFETQKALEKIFAGKAQTENPLSVTETEKDLWKSETHQALPISHLTSNHLKLSRTAMNLRFKD